MYYQLENFYQSNRYFEKSISYMQMLGVDLEADLLTDCGQYITNEQMNKVWSVDGSKLEPNATAYPCGLLAKSYFNDTFALYDRYPNKTNLAIGRIPLNSSDITWYPDQKKFRNLGNDDWQKKQWIDVTSRK